MFKLFMAKVVIGFGCLSLSVASFSNNISNFDSVIDVNPFPQDFQSQFQQHYQQKYIVWFKSGIDLMQIDSVIAVFAAKREVQRFTAINGFSVYLSPMEVAVLANNPLVDGIEQDRTIRVNHLILPEVKTATKAATGAWGIDRIDQQSLPLNGDYSPYYDGSGAHVYVLSSGIRTSHIEFTGRAQSVYIASTIDDGDDDVYGQGTSIAGTVAGYTWGVARGANVYSVKVMNNLGQTSVVGLVEGLEWVANNHQSPAVAVIGMSMGYSAAVNQAVEAAIAAGVSVVVPSGDNLKDACNYSPASVSNAITVAATWQTDEASHYSNRGDCVDIFAPGLYVKSAWPSSDRANNSLSHSPMAAAHVAGAAAIVRANEPSCSVAGVKSKVLAQGQSGVLTNVLGGSPNRYLAVLTAEDNGDACDVVQNIQGTSCKTILDKGNSVGDGIYLIDPDGTNNGVEPFAAYCDMTTQGGGWTLYANHKSGKEVVLAEPVIVDELGALSDQHWQVLRDNMTEGMMFKDDDNRVSAISAAKLTSGNCLSIAGVDSLVDNSNSWDRLWHEEVSGCGGSGGDYSEIILGPYGSIGASLYNLTGLFDVWPYTNNYSYSETDNLQYYIK